MPGGTIAGLTIHTTLEELYRAVLESFAFQSYLAYERMRDLGTEMKCIAATGGGAASELTLQIRADVFGMEVCALGQCGSGDHGVYAYGRCRDRCIFFPGRRNTAGGQNKKTVRSG